MLPTILKSKLPADLAFLFKPKIVSEAFETVPQVANLSISYFYYSSSKSKPVKTTYLAVSVEYFYHKTSQFMPRESGYFGQIRWEIQVGAVPRELKAKIGELVQREAFPHLKSWFLEHHHIAGKEMTLRLSVLYNEDKDELEYQTFHHP